MFTKKMYAILVVVLLTLSVFAGVYLVKRNQDLRKKASIKPTSCTSIGGYCSNFMCPSNQPLLTMDCAPGQFCCTGSVVTDDTPISTTTPLPKPTIVPCSTTGGSCIPSTQCEFGEPLGRLDCGPGESCCVIQQSPTAIPTLSPIPTSTPILPSPTVPPLVIIESPTPTPIPPSNPTSTPVKLICNNNIGAYVQPNPVGTGKPVSIIFTSDQAYSDVQLDPGNGVDRCNLDLVTSARCHDNAMNDGRRCWWKWDCVAKDRNGNYRAKFTNSDNCSKEVDYNVGASVVATPTSQSISKPTNVIAATSATTIPTRITLPQAGVDFPVNMMTLAGVIITLLGFLILL